MVQSRGTDKNGKTYPVVLQCSAANQNIEFVPRANRLIEIEKKEQSEDKTAQQEHGSEKPSQEQPDKKGNWLLPNGEIKPIGKKSRPTICYAIRCRIMR